MQRRELLIKTLAAGVAFAALPWLQTLGAETLGAKTPGARPNIVLIMVDDMQQFNWAWYLSKGALRGSWKAVQRDRDPWTLYDLSKDRSELNDLAALEPEVLKTLVDQWKTWAEQVQFEARPANLLIPPAVPE